MSTQELKEAIQHKLDEVPEPILREVYDYLQGFLSKSEAEQKRLIGLKRILEEDRGLLLRLAE